MNNNRLFSTFLGVVIAGSFSAGIFAPELQARGGLPEVLSSFRPSGNGQQMDPLNTYSKVLQVVRDRYYGDVKTERQMTYTAIRGLLNSLDDPYTRFLDPVEYASLKEENHGEFEGIGAQLYGAPVQGGLIRIVKPIPGGPAERAGVRKGDLISKVDGKPVIGKSVDQVVKMIRGKSNTVVKLTIQRGSDKPVDIPITRQPVEYEVVEYRMLPGNVGYVSLAQFNEMADPKIERAVRDLEKKGAKGIVLDLRGNPGGLLDAAVDVVSRFVPANRGAVIIVESGGERDTRRTNGAKYLAGKFPLVVLVNRTSASASEIVSGAVKDNKSGTVVGTTTFGKGLVQTVVPLQDGSACMITTAKYLTPSGGDINRGRDTRGGVEPDVTVEVTEEEFLKGKDPQLDKAVQVIQEKLGLKPQTNSTARTGAQ